MYPEQWHPLFQISKHGPEECSHMDAANHIATEMH